MGGFLIIFVTAAEVSGDMHAAGLIAALRRRRPESAASASAGRGWPRPAAN